MIRRIGLVFVTWSKRWVPDPFVLALILSLITFGCGVVGAGVAPSKMLEGWVNGFWGFLKFAMQMCLILVTGYALAQAPLLKRILEGLAESPKTPEQATALVALAACLCAWFNWGFGLIVGAVLAREIGIRGEAKGLRLHYPLLGAAGYAGLAIWHGGLSGSAPLKVAEKGHFLEEQIGVVSLGSTVLSPVNLILSLVLVMCIPALMVALLPDESQRTPASVFLPDIKDPLAKNQTNNQDVAEGRDSVSITPAARLENSPWLVALIAIPALSWWGINRWYDHQLNIDTINFFFLFLGLLLHGSASAYAAAISQAARGMAGIVLQFPFYAGIMGMMKSSGLLVMLSDGFINLSMFFYRLTGWQLFPVLSFLSAGVVNLFVPSGGGQWGVQGPIAAAAAGKLGLKGAVAVMSIAYGDEWTNMLQPFWALPLLGLTGLKAKDLIGYTIPIMLVTGVMFIVALMLY